MAEKTRINLVKENLTEFVELRISELVPWEKKHLNPEHAREKSLWYDTESLIELDSADLVWVDGPPGKTCKFSRYPAMAAVMAKLHKGSQVWMDDTIRDEETEICQVWAEMANMKLVAYGSRGFLLLSLH